MRLSNQAWPYPKGKFDKENLGCLYMPYDIIIGRNEADKKNFGEKGLISIGRGYVKMGQYT